MDRIDYEYFGEKGDRFFWFVGKHELLIKLAKEHGPFNRILNLGCGVGEEVSKFSSLGNVVSADIDLFSINYAKKHTDAVRTDTRNISFKDNTFDCVILSDVLEHIKDDKRVMEEVARVTKPKGLIIITVPTIKFLFSTHDQTLGHYRRYSRKELLGLCKGLEIERAGYWNLSNLGVVAPFRLLKKFLNLPSRPDPSRVPEPINKLLLALLRVENRIITGGRSLPVGLTLFAVCRKK